MAPIGRSRRRHRLGSVPDVPLPVTLRGSRVHLEPLGPEHVDGLAAAGSQDRATYAFSAVPHDAATARTYVEAALAEQATGTSLPFAVRTTPGGPVAGSTRFLDLEVWPDGPPLTGLRGALQLDAVPTVGEIGATWYAASVQRTGLNVEAKLLLLGHAFDTWASLRVTLKTDERNARSRTAIERLGARYEGVRRAQMRAADGGVRNTAYYSIVREEWPAVREHLEARLRRGQPAGTTTGSGSASAPSRDGVEGRRRSSSPVSDATAARPAATRNPAE